MKRTLHLMFIMTLVFCSINLFANNYGDNTYQVSIGSGTDTDNSTPFIPRHCYSWNETIYPGTEIGGACTIEAISYHTASVGETLLLDELNIFMAVTQKSAFTTYTDWTLGDNLIKVYSGKDVVVGDTEWEKITLDIPFYYNGNDNLVIVVAKKTSGFNPRSQWYYTKDNASLTYTLFYGNDKSESIAEVPPTTADQGTRMTYRANIILDVVYGEVESPVVTTPNPIDFGYRPAAAWTRPMTVNFTTDSTRAYILNIESLNPSFVVSNYDAPLEVSKENAATVSIKLTNSNVVGELNGKLRVTNNYATDDIEMKAITYSPVSPDVWEKAELVTSYPYANTPDFDKLYNNYYLPGDAQDGPDAVYQLILEETTTLSVGVEGENAKVALYGSDFNGKGGPDTDNYYGAVIAPDHTEPEFPEVEVPVLQGNSFSYDFNDGSLTDWRTIDADGDRYNWSVTTDGQINAGSDVKAIYSFSFHPGINSKLNPDNYIVTKGSYAIEKGSVLEFDVRSFDPDYAKENYEVVVSLDGINFIHLPKETSASTEWTHKSISLADYAGKNIVIGFRHFDVQTKSSAILIDNVVLTSGSRSSFDKTEKYTVPAGTYYLAVSATERFSVNINAATENGFNPVTEVLAQEADDNNVNLCWSWDFINNGVELSDNKSLSRDSRNANQAAVLGYDIYRRNNLTEDETVVIAENVSDTMYVDNTWGNAAMGLYQWGVSAIYNDGNGGTYKTPAAYSNIIGKDMFTAFEVVLTTENGNSPEGAKVTFYNVYEPSYKYEATVDATGRYRWDSFRKGTYRYSLSLEGYKEGPQNATMEIWEEKTLEYTFNEVFVLGDIFVSTTGWAMWNHTDAETYLVKLDGTTVAEVFDNHYQFDVTNLVAGQSYKTEVDDYEYTWTYIPCDDLVQASDFEVEVDDKDISLYWTLPVKDYVEVPSEFRFDFEDGTLNGWLSIDADGDDYSWSNSKQYSQTECGYQSWYSAMSHSCIEAKPLTPDNYLTTAKKYLITENSRLHFNVSAENKNDSEEHYGIAISTKSNYNTADFEMIWEETLPKEENSASFHGLWYEKTIDLSKYAGQEVYIAFRHFNCTDQFWINIDNVELTTAETRKPEGEWLTYDNGKNYDALGLQGGASIYWGMMLPAEKVETLAGRYLTKVSMFDKTSHEGRFLIYLGGDKAPGSLVHAQDYITTGSNDYVEFELTTAVEITGEQNVWVVFNNYTNQYVASNCVGPTEPNGRWFSTNGTDWVDILNYSGYNLTWQISAYVESIPTPNPTNVEVLGAMLYRDGQLLTKTPLTEESYFEVLPEYGDYEYSLRVVYGGEKETYYAMSCPQTIALNHDMQCEAPKNLHGTSTIDDGRIGTLLEWPYTLHGSEWLHYDNGINEFGIGLGGTAVWWGIMFPAEDLEFYNGTLIAKVSVFDYEAHEGNILIYYGGEEAPDMLIHSQPYSCTGIKDFVEFDLTSPIPVDASTNLWIVFNAFNGGYPAPVAEDSGNKNGRWMSTDGENWADIGSVPDLAGTFMVRAFVTSNFGSKSVEMNGNRNDNATFSHYNIYRGTTMDNLELIAQPTFGYYFDEVEKGTYYYQVTSTYFEGEVECESAAANSYLEPENDFIKVEVTSVIENDVNTINVYPNPVKDELIIATEMNVEEIAICDIYGRMTKVYGLQSTDFVHSIDVADLETGIYFINIKTDNGNIVKRFVKN